MKLDANSLAAWDAENHEWKVYPGAYAIMAGSSSRDIRLIGSFDVLRTSSAKTPTAAGSGR
jgi:beta-glucosidase